MIFSPRQTGRALRASSGNVSVSSRSYVITKGKKVVAKTSTKGKSVKLKPGTYKVKSTVKYRTFWVEDTYDSKTEWENAWAVITDTLWDTDNNHGDGQPEKSAVNASDGSYIDYGSCRADEDDWWDLCYDSQGRYLKGSLSNWSGGWYFDATYIGTEVPIYDSVKYYSGHKKISKTQTVKVGKNSGVMTKYEYNKIKKKAKLSKVKSIVGGTGKVIKSTKRGGHTPTSPAPSTATRSASTTARCTPSIGDQPRTRSPADSVRSRRRMRCKASRRVPVRPPGPEGNRHSVCAGVGPEPGLLGADQLHEPAINAVEDRLHMRRER